jgi:hypothetical protein
VSCIITGASGWVYFLLDFLRDATSTSLPSPAERRFEKAGLEEQELSFFSLSFPLGQAGKEARGFGKSFSLAKSFCSEF